MITRFVALGALLLLAVPLVGFALDPQDISKAEGKTPVRFVVCFLQSEFSRKPSAG
jgi:hypothetical protein